MPLSFGLVWALLSRLLLHLLWLSRKYTLPNCRTNLSISSTRMAISTDLHVLFFYWLHAYLVVVDKTDTVVGQVYSTLNQARQLHLISFQSFATTLHLLVFQRNRAPMEDHILSQMLSSSSFANGNPLSFIFCGLREVQRPCRSGCQINERTVAQ